MKEKELKLRIHDEYPYDPNYKFQAKLEIINLDEEREQDIISGNGFFIKEPQNLKKDIKAIDGILSSKYGDTSGDANPFANRYRCDCGKLNSRINHGLICDSCRTMVQYRDDNFKITGWICLIDKYVIHPNLYKKLAFFIGVQRLENIIDPNIKVNEDGHILRMIKNREIEQKKDEPFFGIGISDFKDRFNEVMDFYLSRFPAKKEYYDHIMEHREKVFIQSIPVYTSLLRPIRLDGENLVFEKTNAAYNMMAKLGASINRNQLEIFRKKKTKEGLLYELQTHLNSLYVEIENILAKKKGTIRQLFGGRYNFSTRAVIVPDPELRIDEIKLPYAALVEVLQQTIVNVLKKSYNITYSQAWDMWYMAQLQVNPRIVQIIENIIQNQDNGRGIPFIINRNLKKFPPVVILE